MPLIVGLTGGIATGKTTVSDQFAALGVPVIDTDQISREIVKPGQPALQMIKECFGQKFIRDDGQLDRTRMRDLVFSDDRSRAILESILHPKIEALVLQRIRGLDASSRYCLIVVPLLTETDSYSWVDAVLVVDAPEEEQVRRVMQRDAIDQASAAGILKAQANREERLAKADYVIANDAGLAELQSKVMELHAQFSQLADARWNGNGPTQDGFTPAH